MDATHRKNPCVSCGACCAAFRVSFYWAETDAAPGGRVPAGMTEQLTTHLAVMRGTDRIDIRCVALEGEVGRAVRCCIYAERPTPCRDLEPSWLHGKRNDQCDRARARHGLPPLPADSFA